MESSEKVSLMKVSIVNLFGEKTIKAENVHSDSFDISKTAKFCIRIGEISNYSYYPKDRCDPSSGYSYVEGTFTIYLRNGNHYTFYNHDGGQYVTEKRILKDLYVSYEADAMEKLFEENCSII